MRGCRVWRAVVFTRFVRLGPGEVKGALHTGTCSRQRLAAASLSPQSERRSFAASLPAQHRASAAECPTSECLYQPRRQAPPHPTFTRHGPDKPSAAHQRHTGCRRLLHPRQLCPAPARRLGGKGREAHHRRWQRRPLADHSPSLLGAMVPLGVCPRDRCGAEPARPHHHRPHCLLWRSLPGARVGDGIKRVG